MEPSKAAMERANEIIREVTPENVLTSYHVTPGMNYCDEAFCRFIDRVDRVARELHRQIIGIVPDSLLDGELLSSLMLPDPDPEPDPLEDALIKAWQNYKQQPDALRREAGKIMQALTAAGYEIRKVEP